MQDEVILMQPNSNGKIKYLKLILDGCTVIKQYGLVGGKEQERTATYKAKNVGKTNEKSAEQTAKEALIRDRDKKVKEGYAIVDSMEDTPTFEDPMESLDLDNIPTGFCCSKPTQTITEEEIDNVISSGSAMFFVKYNGGCHYASVKSTGEVKIFTRRWDDHTDKYPEIVAEVKATYPPNSLIIVELCIDPLLGLDHMVAQKRFSEISKIGTLHGKLKGTQEAAIELQKKHPVKAAVFGYMFINGEQCWSMNYADQIDRIEQDVEPLSKGNRLFVPQEVLHVESGKDIMALAIEHKKSIEGFVMWDVREAMEVTMSGKPKRRAAWKVKAKEEMDVIAYAGMEGKVPGKYGSIYIGRYSPAGEIIEMGTVSGLTDKEKEPSFWNFPCVIEVAYDNKFPGTGKLQFGNYVKVHLDKIIEEVDLHEYIS